MKDQDHNIKTMLRLYVIEEQLKRLKRAVLAEQKMTDSEMLAMHNACSRVLEGKEKGLATRAELFALFYFCQPKNLFRAVSKNSPTVKTYARRYFKWDTRLLSYYRGTLAFLYFNDKEFHAVAKETVDAVRADLFPAEDDQIEEDEAGEG
jgi:hypothetical protein